MRLSLSVAALTLLFTFIGVSSLIGQDLDNVSFQGKITDLNSAPIVGATIVALQIDSGSQRITTSNADGNYAITNLKPGIYNVSVNIRGFASVEKTNVQTVSGQVVKFDFQLGPAGVKASATVSASADDTPPVDVTRTVVGGTISQREIEEIPLNSRNPLDLVLTLGGTAEEQLSTSNLAEDRTASVAPLEQGNFSLSGGTAYSNNITIDGLDNNDDRSSRDRFQPSIESIAEVQVISNQFSAEYGRASGGRARRNPCGLTSFEGGRSCFSETIT